MVRYQTVWFSSADCTKHFPEIATATVSKLFVYLVVFGACLSSAQASLMTFSDRGVWSSAAGGAPDFFEDFNRFGTQSC